MKFAGGRDGHVVVISTASSLGEEATEAYRNLLIELGIGRVSGLRPEEREDADAATRGGGARDGDGRLPDGRQPITPDAGGRGHPARRRDRSNAHDRGAVLAGTSAGASAMASHMVAYGRTGPTPKNRMVQLSAGLGILHGLVIDQHFEQRGRIGRLLALVAQSPSLLGMGIDEDTCAIVFADQTLHVIGKGAVTIVDGRNVTTDAYRGKGYKPLMVSGAVLHSLPSGYWFDLRSRGCCSRGRTDEPRSGRRRSRWPPARSGHPPRGPRPTGRRRRREPAAAKPTLGPDLTILQTQVFRGPNYWSYEPCIRMLVDLGSLEHWPSNTIPGFNDALLKLLPGVGEHSCSLGKQGGFGERLEDGTWLGHVAEHVALELQRESGAHISRGKTRSAGRPGRLQRDLRLRRGAGRAGRGRARRSPGEPSRARPRTGFDFHAELERLILLAERRQFGPSTQAIVDEARQPGHPVDPAERGNRWSSSARASTSSGSGRR